MTVFQVKSVPYFFLLYVFNFFLLWEWLRPIAQLTESDYMNVFLGFAAVSLLLAFLKTPPALSASVKLVYIAGTIQWIYFDGFGSIFLFASDIVQNISLIFGREWTGISDSFKTLLFFILLWIMTYLVHYWLVYRKNILLFFLMTVFFITVLDTFSPYQANAAIVRTVLIGFVIMGMLTFYKLAESENISNPNLFTRKWSVSLAAVIAGSIILAYAAPKADPLWPDPVAFVQSFNNASDTAIGETARVGYRVDDSELGGPFLSDNSVVFRAEVEKPHYWKVETRDTYTGKGWISSNQNAPSSAFKSDVPAELFSFTDRVPSTKATSIVYNEMTYSHIQYPHGLQNIELETDASYVYRLNEQTGRISAFSEFGRRAPLSYTVHFNQPDFQPQHLQESSPETADNAFDEISKKYTQLPENLPDSVHTLALEITAGKTTWFDKAKAIEEYFQSNGFIYDQLNVATPSEDEDYVAQFLFETKRGYCDNFSTSMAVLLRTLDIPSRWVKGFNDGTYIETAESGNPIYEVANNNAHSWVEAYFPGIGWVPFEPTIGFVNNSVPDLEAETTAAAPASDNAEIPPEAAESAEREERDQQTAKPDLFWTKPFENAAGFLKKSAPALFILCILLIGAAFLSYRYREKWLPFYYIYKFKRAREDIYFPTAYLILLDQLNRSGFKRKPNQTLSDYAKEIDSLFSNTAMSQLTNEYERFFYRGNLQKGIWDSVKTKWEALMKQTRL